MKKNFNGSQCATNTVAANAAPAKAGMTNKAMQRNLCIQAAVIFTFMVTAWGIVICILG